MCFNVEEGFNKPKIATKDIIVWKAFKYNKFLFENDIGEEFDKNQGKLLGFLSGYKNFHYNFGECYYEDSMKKNRKSTDTGLHIGLHSYSTFMKATDDFSQQIKCIIPEGSTYWYNSDEEIYLSDYLIIGNKEDLTSNN